MLLSKLAEVPDLVGHKIARILVRSDTLFIYSLQVLECVFVIAPDVGQNCVLSHILGGSEELEFCSGRMKEPHEFCLERQSAWIEIEEIKGRTQEFTGYVSHDGEKASGVMGRQATWDLVST